MIQIHPQIPFLFGSVESGYKYFLISIRSAFDALTIDFYFFFQMNHDPFPIISDGVSITIPNPIGLNVFG